MRKIPKISDFLFYIFVLFGLGVLGYVFKSRLFQGYPYPKAQLCHSEGVSWYCSFGHDLQGVEEWDGRVLTNNGDFYMHEWPERKELTVLGIRGRIVVYHGSRWRMLDSVVLQPCQEFHLMDTAYEIKTIDSATLAKRISTRGSSFSILGWSLNDIIWYLQDSYPLSGHRVGKGIDTAQVYRSKLQQVDRGEPLEIIISKLQSDSVIVKIDSTSVVFARRTL